MGFFADINNEFSTAQAVTGTAMAISTNVIDLAPVTKSALKDITGGRDMYVRIWVSESFATATSVTFTLESDSTANLATSATTHATTGAIAIANLTAGTFVYIRVPEGRTFERYLGMRYTIGGSSATAGKVTAVLTSDRPIGNIMVFDNNITIA